jgi:hypothetical protein
MWKFAEKGEMRTQPTREGRIPPLCNCLPGKLIEIGIIFVINLCQKSEFLLVEIDEFLRIGHFLLQLQCIGRSEGSTGQEKE